MLLRAAAVSVLDRLRAALVLDPPAGLLVGELPSGC